MRRFDSPNEHFPSVAQAVLLLLANFLLEYLVGALLYDLHGALGLTAAQTTPLVMVIAYGILVVSVMHYCGMGYRDLLHSTKSSVSVTLVLLVPPVLLLVPFALLLDDAVMAVVRQLLPLSRWEEQAFTRMMSGNLPAIIAVCVLAPVFEEMLFRGILLRAFLNHHPRWAAISYSALLFGVAHLNVYQFLLAFSLGLLLGWLYERSRSLLPCIALHAAYNTSVTVLDSMGGSQEVGAPAWLAALAAAGTGAVILRRLLATPPRRTADAA